MNTGVVVGFRRQCRDARLLSSMLRTVRIQLMTADDQDKIGNVVVGTDRAHQPHHRNGITSHPDPETEVQGQGQPHRRHRHSRQHCSKLLFVILPDPSAFLAYPTSSSTLLSPGSSNLTPVAHTASPSLRSHKYPPRAHLSNPPRQLQLSTTLAL